MLKWHLLYQADKRPAANQGQQGTMKDKKKFHCLSTTALPCFQVLLPNRLFFQKQLIVLSLTKPTLNNEHLSAREISILFH